MKIQQAFQRLASLVKMNPSEPPIPFSDAGLPQGPTSVQFLFNLMQSILTQEITNPTETEALNSIRVESMKHLKSRSKDSYAHECITLALVQVNEHGAITHRSSAKIDRFVGRDPSAYGASQSNPDLATDSRSSDSLQSISTTSTTSQSSSSSSRSFTSMSSNAIKKFKALSMQSLPLGMKIVSSDYTTPAQDTVTIGPHPKSKTYPVFEFVFDEKHRPKFLDFVLLTQAAHLVVPLYTRTHHCYWFSAILRKSFIEAFGGNEIPTRRGRRSGSFAFYSVVKASSKEVNASVQQVSTKYKEIVGEVNAKRQAARKVWSDSENKRQEMEGRFNVEAELRREAESKAEIEARGRMEEARQRLEETRRRTEAETKAQMEARRRMEESRRRTEAETKAQLETRRRTEAEAKSKAAELENAELRKQMAALQSRLSLGTSRSTRNPSSRGSSRGSSRSSSPSPSSRSAQFSESTPSLVEPLAV